MTLSDMPPFDVQGARTVPLENRVLGAAAPMPEGAMQIARVTGKNAALPPQHRPVAACGRGVVAQAHTGGLTAYWTDGMAAFKARAAAVAAFDAPKTSRSCG